MADMTKAELQAALDAKIAELEQAETKIAELTELAASLHLSDAAPLDPLSLLTPEALSGIKPTLRVIKDGTRFFPFLSYKEAQKMRALAAFLTQLEAAATVEG